jgi:hypothetical protein
MSTKRCTKCGEVKDFSEFSKDRSRKYGLYAYCKSCQALLYQDDPRKFMLRNARGRAAKKGIPFDLRLEDIHIPEKCPILGLKLGASGKCSGPSSPTLDRIVPEGGYVPQNIQVLSSRANMMKSDASPEELVAFSRYMLSIYDPDYTNANQTHSAH